MATTVSTNVKPSNVLLVCRLDCAHCEEMECMRFIVEKIRSASQYLPRNGRILPTNGSPSGIRLRNNSCAVPWRRRHTEAWMRLERQAQWNHCIIDRRFYMASDVSRRTLESLFPTHGTGRRRLAYLCGLALVFSYCIGAIVDRMFRGGSAATAIAGMGADRCAHSEFVTCAAGRRRESLAARITILEHGA